MGRISEAFINEYKGNLFEFLVAQNMAREFGLEGQFLDDLLPAFKEKLVLYEKEIKKLEPAFAMTLPELAKLTLKAFVHELPWKPNQIFLVGKIAKNAGTELDTTDVLLLNERNETFGISLKLGKDMSFVNTKSGGVKSFIEEYFPHQRAPVLQRELNEELLLAYQNFGNSLYSVEEFGTFDEFVTWRKKGLTELPGELKDEHQQILYRYYNECAKAFYRKLSALQQENERYFHLGLMRVLGFSQKPMLQVMTSHHDHEFSGVRLSRSSELADLHFIFKELSVDEIETSSIHLLNEKLQLQIRMKPMNVFTTPSMKVNCSVKYK